MISYFVLWCIDIYVEYIYNFLYINWVDNLSDIEHLSRGNKKGIEKSKFNANFLHLWKTWNNNFQNINSRYFVSDLAAL